MMQPLWKAAWPFLTELNILLPYDSAVELPDVYPNEFETYIQNPTQERV